MSVLSVVIACCIICLIFFFFFFFQAEDGIRDLYVTGVQTCALPILETRDLANPQKLEDEIVNLIHKEHPEWDGKHGVCTKCREQYRAKKFLGYLEDEYAKISDLEKNLVTKIARRGQVAKKVNDEFDQDMTTGERIADRVAQFGGSWTFILIFGGILLTWVCINSISLILRTPFDPFPYILLNLVLSMLAALQ